LVGDYVSANEDAEEEVKNQLRRWCKFKVDN